MAKLKDTLVSGSLRATDTIYTTTVQAQIIQALISSDGTTYGPGSNGQVLKSNGTSVYWGTDNNTWRGIQDNLTSSTNTTESLSAKQGYLLANGSARDNTKLPLSGGTITGDMAYLNGLLKLIDSTTTARTWSYAISCLRPSMSQGEHVWLPIGKSLSTGNCGGIAFDYDNDNSNNNAVGIEFFGKRVATFNNYGNLTLKRPLGILYGGTGATTADGACANIGAVKKSGDTMTGTLVVNRTSNGGEADIEAKSTAGSIYLYSAGSNTGNRGIYTTNANGTGKGVITIDQNNNITFDGNAATANAVSWTNVTNKAIDLTLSSSLDADAVRTTNGIWICSNAITNAPTVNHGALFGIASVGTPCQYFMPDNSYYTYKRYYSSSAWTNWTKIYAGYADSSGSCTGNAATATKATQDSDGNTISSTYLKLNGGTMTGWLTAPGIFVKGTTYQFYIMLDENGIESGHIRGERGDSNLNNRIVFRAKTASGKSEDFFLPVATSNTDTWYDILTTKYSISIAQGGTGATTADGACANIGAVKKSGDTMTGALGFANNTWNPVGDDVYIGDCNMGGCLGIKGQNGSSGLMFYSQDGNSWAKMYFDGTNFVSTNPITLLYNNSTKLRLFADNEGGNIVITSPDGHEYQFDAYNGDHLRLFSFDDGGNYHNLTWYRSDGRLYVEKLNVGDALSTRANLGAALGTYTSGEVQTGGKWIDGKTIYRYTWKGDATVRGNSVALFTLPRTPDTVISIIGMRKNSSTGTWWSIPYAYYSNPSGWDLTTYIEPNTNRVILQAGSSHNTSADTFVIIVEYAA